MEEQKKMEEQKIKKAKREVFYFKNIKMEKEMIKNSDYLVKIKVFVSDKEFYIEIKYDMDRSKFQCWITHSTIRKSLSFFQKKEQAFENALNFVIISAGEQQSNLLSAKVGD